MADINSLWNEMVDAGYNVRKARLDGLASWQPYKEKYSKYVSANGDIKIPLRPDFVEFVKKLDYRTIDAKDQSDATLTVNGVVLDNKTETDHFIIQHFRIPIMENYNLSIVKLAQLAYNIGQFSAATEFENAYGPQVVDFYVENNLSCLAKYVTVTDQYRYIEKKY